MPSNLLPLVAGRVTAPANFDVEAVEKPQNHDLQEK